MIEFAQATTAEATSHTVMIVIAVVGQLLSVGLILAATSRWAGRLEQKVKMKVGEKECGELREGIDDKFEAERSKCQADIKQDFRRLWERSDALCGDFKETRGRLDEAVNNVKESTKEVKEAVKELKRANGSRS